jgi:hypothetical protein
VEVEGGVLDAQVEALREIWRTALPRALAL